MLTNPTEIIAPLALVKAEPGGGILGNASDDELNSYILGISQYWLQRCGVYSLSTIYTVTEKYNGNGQQRLKLRQPPINSITTLTIGSSVIPTSTSYTKQGVGIEDNQNFIFLRGYTFCKGLQNIFVTYNAGNNGAPADIVQAFVRHVMLAYKRKDSINEKMLSISSGGSTTFLNDIELTSDIERVIRLHTRLGL